MSEPVRCEVCGKLFSSSHVKAHKRLAHVKGKVRGADGQDGMKTILELYDRLSSEDKERLLAELAAREGEPT